MTDPAAFRGRFPVLATRSYLNAGTEGPMPAAAAEAVQAQVERALTRGRADRSHVEVALELASRVRAGYGAVLGAEPESVALTGSTTDGVNSVLGGLRFSAGDEVVTSDQEHPGLLAPLRRLRELFGVRVTVAPFGSVAACVGPDTRLIACSHVSWVGGEVVDVPALVATGVPVLLDGAQGLGAVPLDVGTMGVDFYAGSGQKWLCGPEGAGALYVRPDRLDSLEPPWPGYATVAAPDDALRSGLASGAARLDTGFPAVLRSTWALASLDVLSEAGWAWVYERASSGAARLAASLAARGLEVMPRGVSTLVSWRDTEPAATVARLAESEIVVRYIPAAGLIRASVGAWTSDEELDALVDAVAKGS